MGDYAALCDGAGELQFDDVESAMAVFESDIGQQLRVDTATFAESAKATRFFARDAAVRGMSSVEADAGSP